MVVLWLLRGGERIARAPNCAIMMTVCIGGPPIRQYAINLRRLGLLLMALRGWLFRFLIFKVKDSQSKPLPINGSLNVNGPRPAIGAQVVNRRELILKRYSVSGLIVIIAPGMLPCFALIALHAAAIVMLKATDAFDCRIIVFLVVGWRNFTEREG